MRQERIPSTTTRCAEMFSDVPDVVYGNVVVVVGQRKRRKWRRSIQRLDIEICEEQIAQCDSDTG